MAQKPQVIEPKVPIAAVTPPAQSPSQTPPGRNSLIATAIGLKQKPALTMKNSLLG